MSQSNQPMRLPSSVANAAFFKKGVTSANEADSVGLAKIISESKKMLGLDPNKEYLSSNEGVQVKAEDTETFPEVKRSPIGKGKFCSQCGVKVNEGSKYCSECGGKV